MLRLSVFLFSGIFCSGAQWSINSSSTTGGCPSTCRCGHRRAPHQGTVQTTVICHASNISQPSLLLGLPRDTEVLDLTSNDLQELDDASFSSLVRLRDLDLDGNRITGVESALANLSFLRSLSISGNLLEVLEERNFHGLAVLETLNVSVNRISRLDPGCFSTLTSLVDLDLSDNRMRSLEPGTFSNLAALKNLRLDRNLVEFVDAAAFRGLFRLENLSMSSNRLGGIDPDALVELGSLRYLDVAGNRFESVPSVVFRPAGNTLRRISMAANPVPKIASRDFYRMPGVVQLDLSRMSELRIVDSEAFSQLERLEVLRLSDNPRLSYVHPGSIAGCPRLRELYLHSDDLTSVDLRFDELERSLQRLRIDGNPIRCDCGLASIQTVLREKQGTRVAAAAAAACNNVSSCALEPASFRVPVCSSPPSLKGTPVVDVPATHLVDCPPSVIPFFRPTIHRKLGDNLTLDCRGTGDPSPKIFWTVPNNHTSSFRVDDRGTLTLTGLKPPNAGLYRCTIDKNSSAKTFLRIYNPEARVLPLATDYDSVTVTWSGTNTTIGSTDYAIAYRTESPTGGVIVASGVIHLSRYMKKYTVTGLRPDTVYEFCMTYVTKDDVTYVTKDDGGDGRTVLNCVRFSTRSGKAAVGGIRRIPVAKVLLVAAVVLSCSFVICVATRTVLRTRQRTFYQQPNGLDQYRKVNEVSQIPLDSIYPPPSTPIATSRTSLVGIH